MYQEMLATITTEFSDKSITPSDMDLFKSLFNRQNVISILEHIVSHESLVELIASRSYTHALGFDKIILVDLSKDSNSRLKNQVRLHIWDPAAHALPIVEALHEHSFDFISTVLSGHLENQRFKINKLSQKQSQLLKVIQETKDLKFLNSQIELLEAYKLKSLGSSQFDDLGQILDIEYLKDWLNLSEQDVLNLTTIEGHYVSNRVAGEKKAYSHVLKEYVSVQAQDVLQISQGQYYFHPHQLAHRLYYDNKVLNSTILVTTHVANNPEGGSLQRPSYVQTDEQHYDKISFTPERMKEKLQSYISFLKSRQDLI